MVSVLSLVAPTSPCDVNLYSLISFIIFKIVLLCGTVVMAHSVLSQIAYILKCDVYEI